MSFTLWRGVVGMVRPTRRPGTLEELIRILPEGIGIVPLLLNFKAVSTAEFKRLTDRGLADVIAANQKGMAVEIHNAVCDAPKIFDGQSPDAHCVAPNVMNKNNRSAA